MKKILLILIFEIISSNCLYAQGINNLWLMGYENYHPIHWGGTNINFISGSPAAYYEPNRKMEIQITTCNVADSLGNLLFYSNGAWIANRDNKLMVNGDTLNPSSYTRSRYTDGFRLIGSQIAIKCPGSDSLYYLIPQTVDDGQIVFADKCYYSIIDMSQDSGRGAVMDKNHVMFHDTLNAQMSVCKHANGRDWWVIIPQWNHPAYYV